MRIKIDSRHYLVTPAVKKMIEEKAVKFEKFIHNITDAHFVLSVEKYRYTAEIVLFAKNIVLKCKEVAANMETSVEKALHKMDCQLRQFKEKIKTHHDKHCSNLPDEKQARSKAEQKIVKEDNFDIKPMSIDEAVAELKTMKRHFLVFKDEEKGGVSILYKRKDGKLGLIEV